MQATSEFQLLLTYSTSSRHSGQAKAGSAAPLAQFFASGASHSESVRSYNLLSSCIVSGLRYMRVNAAVRRDRSRFKQITSTNVG